MIENRTKIKKNNAMYTIFVFFSHLFHISFEFGQDYKAIIVESFMLLPFFLSVSLAASRYRSVSVFSVLFFIIGNSCHRHDRYNLLCSSLLCTLQYLVVLVVVVTRPFVFDLSFDSYRIVSISLCAFIFLSVISPPKLIAKCCATFSYFAL